MDFEFFPDVFSKNTQKSNLMKIRPEVAQLLHADTDGRTDENDEVNSRLTASSPTRPKKKKKRSLLSANRLGNTENRPWSPPNYKPNL